MTRLAKFDSDLEQIIAELTVRIVVPTFSEFDSVWESANKVCDRFLSTSSAHQ